MVISLVLLVSGFDFQRFLVFRGVYLESWLHTRFLHEEMDVIAFFEYYAGSGTSLLGKALETNQGAQNQQKTTGRRGLGNLLERLCNLRSSIKTTA